MKIGIIGAGFTGLAAGLFLSEKGHKVAIFEKEEKPGGLTIGFKEPNWKWILERHYHHIFVSDYSIRELAKKVGQKIIFERPKTSTFIDGDIYQLDSPFNLLLFPKLSVLDRIRTGIILLYLKLTPFWKPLEKITASDFLKSAMGKVSWRILWEPLFEKKFGEYKNEISASWFWARIKKRSASLGYPVGGFEEFAKRVEETISKNKGIFYYGTQVSEIRKMRKGLEIVANGENYNFDRIICTLPSGIFVKITKNLPSSYTKNLLQLKGLGAVNLILTLDKKFLEDGTYWLNVNEKKFPFLAVVEHTNFINPRFYSGDKIIYVGNYLPYGHPYFQKNADGLLREFTPFLKKINPKFHSSWVKYASLFKTPFAQPVIPLNYSKKLPKLNTPIPGLYLANIEQVYPWDRGTNYAVELGGKAAKLCLRFIH